MHDPSYPRGSPRASGGPLAAGFREARGHRSPMISAIILLAASLSGCLWRSSGEPILQGYIEGTYINVAAEAGGKIAELMVDRGQPVEKGAILFRLTDDEEKALVAQAEARVAQAEAQLGNLKSGKRTEEVQVVEAQLARAHAALDAAEKDSQRATDLFARRVVSQADVDQAKSKRDVARAQTTEAERQVAVARLPARQDEVAAAERNLFALRASLDLARVQLQRRTVKSPDAGVIEESYFRTGEFVAAAQPVVSLLPVGARKVRFYLPEPQLASVHVGDRITVACDRCASGMTAEVTFIATQSEYTPPVIYSRDSRGKLVYRVEARPTGEAAAIPVGQPVDVTLGPPAAIAGALP